MNRKDKENFKLKPEDISAILCALPLVQNITTDNSEQTLLNRTCCDIAAKKLMDGNLSFHYNEIRVMFVAVGFALDLLTGTENPFLSNASVSDSWKSRLTKYLFNYNRLYPYFEELSQKFISR